MKEGLLPAFYSGRNIKARTYTMAASIMGAIAFDKGLGAGHAVSYVIGGMFKVHHGRVMGMPANLKELGIRKQHIPDIAQKTLEDANIHTNPVKMDAKKMQDLLTHALKG
ncbi:MAG: iron-containing alcohol dehydrogenase [Desulfotignum sp.]|nr:iron-containing alcohol dehydrogenase [Desulfotignum sp.]MCF8087551.1 iron-containing alcohol dehydrogenase [Desulfotignum sp.]MCF8136328.1 iron-containing alcohol dehydrogenase [Desulfotignum sp.]